MQYKVVKKISIWGLNRKINALINEGWKPQGGVQIAMFGFIQAMVKG